ncbi:MAG: hypothetical protein KDA37_07300 [Planctomycetales bacterium]|nr:hypothetical protein [Planctomycetales bacterium]
MKLVSLTEAKHEIRDGDLLLFRRRGVIATAGRGVHAHAAKAVWWGDDLFCVEVREWFGGRAVTLASQVRRRAGAIDVFAANPENRWPEYDREAAAAFMRNLAGCDYGYLAVCRAALLHLPVVRNFVKPATEDTARNARPPFCSQACAMADRIAGGVDPVPSLSDRLTEPADLARSPFYEYRFTLRGGQ